AWAESGIPPINVSVNLSAVQFKERNLIENISQIIKDTGINPKNLTLEITESTIMETGPEVIQQLSALNGLGLKLAIDDFGTGYSSLAYLKQFPIHYLKIDRAFVQDLPDDKEDCAITRAVIGMARELNLGVVAEGIETPEQMAFLREEGCNYGQGYFIGRPMPRQEFEQWYQHFLNNKTLSIAVDNDSRNSDKDSGSSPKAQDG
ncbi:EAL domain-containing protein, partial [bacterium]|nr:EAL domain-containing protein [bacterium]